MFSFLETLLKVCIAEIIHLYIFLGLVEDKLYLAELLEALLD